MVGLLTIRAIDRCFEWFRWNIIAPCGLINWLNFPSNRFHIAHTECRHRSPIGNAWQPNWKWKLKSGDADLQFQMAIKTTLTHTSYHLRPIDSFSFAFEIWIAIINCPLCVHKPQSDENSNCENQSFRRVHERMNVYVFGAFELVRLLYLNIFRTNTSTKSNERFNKTKQITHAKRQFWDLHFSSSKSIRWMVRLARCARTHPRSFDTHIFTFVLFLENRWRGKVWRKKKRLSGKYTNTEASCKTKGPFEISWNKKREFQMDSTIECWSLLLFNVAIFRACATSCATCVIVSMGTQ